MGLLGLQNTGKKCDCTRAEYSSQIRWQQHSAYRAGEGEALQSCLCSSTANVFYFPLTVCKSLVHTNICRWHVHHSVPPSEQVPADSSMTAPLSSASWGFDSALLKVIIKVFLHPVWEFTWTSFQWAFLAGFFQLRLSSPQIVFLLVPMSCFNGKFQVLLMFL